jgi:hypothetical protein
MIKHNEKIKLSEELVRIHAHLCGDGGLYKYKTSEEDRINRAYIIYCNKNIKLINSFRKDMNYLFNVKMTYLAKAFVVKVSSIRIANYLLELSEYGARKWRIPKIIKKSSRKYKLEWIKAFSLDEGYLPPDRNFIRIKCMNLNGLKDIKEILDSLEIYSNITGPNCDDSYYINIKKEAELKNFSKIKMRK